MKTLPPPLSKKLLKPPTILKMKSRGVRMVLGECDGYDQCSRRVTPSVPTRVINAQFPLDGAHVNSTGV